MFLEWKMNQSFFQFENCLCLNFDYIDVNLSIPQIATTPESELKLTFDFPSSCFFVIVGGKYLNKIGSVMEKVDSIINDIGGTRAMAVFIISNNDNDDILVVTTVEKHSQRSNSTKIISYRVHFLHNITYFT